MYGKGYGERAKCTGQQQHECGDLHSNSVSIKPPSGIAPEFVGLVSIQHLRIDRLDAAYEHGGCQGRPAR
jgi:hypothetical protein